MKKILIIAIILILAGALAFVIWAKFLKNPSPSNSQNQENSNAKTTFEKSVFFVHHSTGEIYWTGGMEKALTDAGYNAAAPWWDGNTDPPDFYNEFSNPDRWKILEPYDIIIFKSCFPASDITSNEMLEQYKNDYNQLYEIFRAHQDKLFVPMSTPPLLKNHTTPEAAQRALEFEKWLLGEYKDNYDGKNLAPFGLHSLLSDENGYLKNDFVVSTEDDHPNAHSGEVVGEAIVEHLSLYVK
jgi:hypothetical protein